MQLGKDKVIANLTNAALKVWRVDSIRELQNVIATRSEELLTPPESWPKRIADHGRWPKRIPEKGISAWGSFRQLLEYAGYPKENIEYFSTHSQAMNGDSLFIKKDINHIFNFADAAETGKCSMSELYSSLIVFCDDTIKIDYEWESEEAPLWLVFNIFKIPYSLVGEPIANLGQYYLFSVV